MKGADPVKISKFPAELVTHSLFHTQIIWVLDYADQTTSNVYWPIFFNRKIGSKLIHHISKEKPLAKFLTFLTALDYEFNQLKSVNLQYNMLGCLEDATNQWSTKRLMFQVSFFFMISCKILSKNPFNLFSYFF